MNRQSTHGYPDSNQRGAGTLVVVLILLLLSSLVIFFTARNAINEQRLSANEIRSKQAFDAASAGLDIAFSYFTDGGNSLSTTLSTPTLYDGSGRPAYFQATFCSPSAYATANPPACPTLHTVPLSCTPPASDEQRTPIILSCGWSDDDQAVVRNMQQASGTPSLAGAVTSPVVSRGTTNLLTGGASIFNYFNDLTIWSGGNVPIQSNTGKSFIRDVSTDSSPTSSDYRTTGNSPSCNNPPSHYTCSTDGISLGPDVIPQDSFLTSMTTDQFFANFMGKTPTPYRDTVATYRVDLNNGLTNEDSTSLASISGMTDETIWVEGDASGLGDIGTADHPVVLVINGNLDLGANTVINGFVFVTGNVSGGAGATIYGALVATGNVGTNGNLKVIYDPKVLKNAESLGQAALVPGGWRDW